MDEVAHRAEKVVQAHAHARGKEQGGRLAHNAADGQNTARHDAVTEEGAPRCESYATCPRPSPGPLPEGLRDGLEGLLGGADDGWDGDDHQSQRAGQQGSLKPQKLAEKEHAHQAEDDGGDAGEGLGGKLDGGHQAAVAGVLGEVDGRADPQGQGDDQGDPHEIDCVEDIGQDADGVLDEAGLGAEELPGDMGQALEEDIADDEEQQGAGQGCMKVMMYGMPLLSAYWAYIMPAAVGFYWIISTLVGFAQTLITHKYFSPEQVSAKSEASRYVTLLQADRKVKPLPANLQKQIADKIEAKNQAQAERQAAQKEKKAAGKKGGNAQKNKGNSTDYLGSKK